MWFSATPSLRITVGDSIRLSRVLFLSGYGACLLHCIRSEHVIKSTSTPWFWPNLLSFSKSTGEHSQWKLFPWSSMPGSSLKTQTCEWSSCLDCVQTLIIFVRSAFETVKETDYCFHRFTSWWKKLYWPGSDLLLDKVRCTEPIASFISVKDKCSIS